MFLSDVSNQMPQNSDNFLNFGANIAASEEKLAENSSLFTFEKRNSSVKTSHEKSYQGAAR